MKALILCNSKVGRIDKDDDRFSNMIKALEYGGIEGIIDLFT